jgi:hypothetical protein
MKSCTFSWPHSILIGLTLLFNITIRKKWVICLHFLIYLRMVHWILKWYTFTWPHSFMLIYYSVPFLRDTTSSATLLPNLWVKACSRGFSCILQDTGWRTLFLWLSHWPVVPSAARPIENVTKHALYPVSNGVMYLNLNCQCSVLNSGHHCTWKKHSTNMLTLHMLKPLADAHYQWLGTSHPTATQSSHFSSAQTLVNRRTVMSKC